MLLAWLWLRKLSALLVIVKVLLRSWSTDNNARLRGCSFVFTRWRQWRLSRHVRRSPRRFLRAVLDVMWQHRVRIVESSSDLPAGVVRGGLPDIRVLVLRAACTGARMIQAVTAVATHIAAAESRVDGVFLRGRLEQIDRRCTKMSTGHRIQNRSST